MLVIDRLTVHDKRRTSDGYLVTSARFARTGIYEYAGRDVGKPEMSTVSVYRPEDEVFSRDAMASFAHKPITNDHPNENVTAATWKRDAVGMTDGHVARDGDFIVIPMMVADAAAIEAVDSGKVELSAGYACDLEFIDGSAPDGSHYDAVMRNIRGNHIALVDKGRAGSECRVGDSFTQETVTMQLQSIIVDGITLETTAQGAQALKKLQDQLQASTDASTQAANDHKAAMDAKDRDLAERDAKITELEGKVLDAKALDALVADRSKLVSQAVKLVPTLSCDGKDAGTIKREVVQAKRGEAAVKDKSDAYVDATYDLLVEAAVADSGAGDTFREALINGGTGGSGGDARAAMNDAFDKSTDFNGWRTKAPA